MKLQLKENWNMLILNSVIRASLTLTSCNKKNGKFPIMALQTHLSEKIAVC